MSINISEYKINYKDEIPTEVTYIAHFPPTPAHVAINVNITKEGVRANAE
jgi:hypothetical protein